jgi:type II secretion system protein J
MRTGGVMMRREATPAIRDSAKGAVLPRKTGMTGAFTLVEIVLAIALSALLLTIVYWTYFSINRSVDAATESQDALDTGRTLSELIKRDIRAIRPAPYSLVGKNTVIQNSSFGELEFVTNALSGTDPQRLRRVGYALILSDNDKKTLVRRESTDLSDLLDKSPADYLPKIFEVSTEITGFLVEFYDNGNWVQAWDSGVTGQMPTQIRVTIDVSDAKGKIRRFVAEEAIQSAVQ